MKPTSPRRLLILLAAINFSNFFDRQLLSTLVEPIKQAFDLSDMQMGQLNSAFEIAYPLAAVVLGVLADRWARKRVIAIGVAVWSLATLGFGLAGSYLALALTRVGLGIGSGAYGPVGLALLSDAFPDKQRGRVVALHDVGLMAGAALGYILGGVLGDRFGWRAPFLVAGLPGMVLAVLAWRIREPQRGASELATLGENVEHGNPKPQADFSLNTLRQVFAVRTLWVVYLVNILISFATGGLIFWMPTFLIRVHGFSLVRAGMLAGILQVVAGLIGILAGGWLADKWAQRHPGGRLLTLGMAYLVGTPFVVVALLSTNVVLFGAAAGIAIICYTVYFPTLPSQIQDVTPPSLRATALAFSILLGHVLGHLPSAPFMGWLSDTTGSLRIAMLMVPVVALVGGLAAFWGVRSAGSDRQQMLANLQND